MQIDPLRIDCFSVLNGEDNISILIYIMIIIPTPNADKNRRSVALSSTTPACANGTQGVRRASRCSSLYGRLLKHFAATSSVSSSSDNISILISYQLKCCQEPPLRSTQLDHTCVRNGTQGVRRASRCSSLYGRLLKHSPLLLLSARAARSRRLHSSTRLRRQQCGQLSRAPLPFDDVQVLLGDYCHSLVAVKTVAQISRELTSGCA